MTTGTKILLPFAQTTIAGTPYTYGTWCQKSWSGGDSVTVQKPRASYPQAKFIAPVSLKRTVIGSKMVRYGGREHFQLVLSPRVVRRKAVPREKKERGLVYNPLAKRWENRLVEEHQALRSEWLRKVAMKRSLPPNNYSMTKETIRRSVWLTWEGNYMNTVPVGNTPWPNPVIDVSQEYKLIDKLRKKIYGSGFNPGILLMESAKSIPMIGNAAYRLGAAIHRFRKGDWRGMFEAFGVEPRQVHRWMITSDGKWGLHRKRAHSDYQWRDARKKVSGLWLELSYGWKPLLSDMEAGAAWLAYALNPPVNSGGRVMGRRAWERTDWVDTPNYGNLTFRKRVISYKLQIVIRGVVVSPSFSAPSLPSLAAIAWEWTPYSFVSDWAVPIGAWLQAMRTARDIRGTVVRTLMTETVCSDLSPGKVGYNNYRPKLRMAGITDEYRKFELVRTVSTELKVPSPFTGLIDGHATVFSAWQRTANAVALLCKGDYRKLSQGFSTKR